MNEELKEKIINKQYSQSENDLKVKIKFIENELSLLIKNYAELKLKTNKFEKEINKILENNKKINEDILMINKDIKELKLFESEIKNTQNQNIEIQKINKIIKTKIFLPFLLIFIAILIIVVLTFIKM